LVMPRVTVWCLRSVTGKQTETTVSSRIMDQCYLGRNKAFLIFKFN
jgi:hypothetical protein